MDKPTPIILTDLPDEVLRIIFLKLLFVQRSLSSLAYSCRQLARFIFRDEVLYLQHLKISGVLAEEEGLFPTAQVICSSIKLKNVLRSHTGLRDTEFCILRSIHCMLNTLTISEPLRVSCLDTLISLVCDSPMKNIENSNYRGGCVASLVFSKRDFAVLRSVAANFATAMVRVTGSSDVQPRDMRSLIDAGDVTRFRTPGNTWLLSHSLWLNGENGSIRGPLRFSLVSVRPDSQRSAHRFMMLETLGRDIIYGLISISYFLEEEESHCLTAYFYFYVPLGECALLTPATLSDYVTGLDQTTTRDPSDSFSFFMSKSRLKLDGKRAVDIPVSGPMSSLLIPSKLSPHAETLVQNRSGWSMRSQNISRTSLKTACLLKYRIYNIEAQKKSIGENI